MIGCAGDAWQRSSNLLDQPFGPTGPLHLVYEYLITGLVD